ncbi:hypothetical protein [Streptomyces sp. NRRL S-118]|uniref:hypothetical protein n=1 Tax=Streptomyces sp. NRRL S-118 TaxID=1463881 RepID=UPI0004CBD410|nr:hypothetical protein [Streptomyces sp. NRRL S-118]
MNRRKKHQGHTKRKPKKHQQCTTSRCPREKIRRRMRAVGRGLASPQGMAALMVLRTVVMLLTWLIG